MTWVIIDTNINMTTHSTVELCNKRRNLKMNPGGTCRRTFLKREMRHNKACYSLHDKWYFSNTLHVAWDMSGDMFK